MNKFLLTFLDDSKDSLENIDSRKLKRINNYLKSTNQEPIDKKDINKILYEIIFYIEKEELAF